LGWFGCASAARFLRARGAVRLSDEFDMLSREEREEYEDDLISFSDRELDLLGDVTGLQVLYAGGSSPYRELASFPVFISNSAVQNVLRVLTDLENQRTELLVRRTPENIDIQRIDRRIGELEVQLYAMARSYREGLDSQIASLDDALSEFGIQLEAVPAQQLTFARLTREKRLLEEIYTLLQSRLKEAEIRKAGEPTDVRVLDAALVPEKPVSPRPMLNLVLGLMLGLMLGTGAALARVIVDPKVRSRTDAIAATSGLPVIGR
jgi:uncharacterized protein involved in exopolysaccharide biosynthesis